MPPQTKVRTEPWLLCTVTPLMDVAHICHHLLPGSAAAVIAVSSYSQYAREPHDLLIFQGCRAVPPSDWLEVLPPCLANYIIIITVVCKPVYVCGHCNEAYSASITRASSLLAPAWWMRPFLIFRCWDVISHSSVRRLGWFMIHSFTWATQFISWALLTTDRGFVGIEKKWQS